MSSAVRRWAVGVGFAGGAVAAAAMIGSAGAPVARADTPVDVMDQASQYLVQGTAALDAADTADLSTRQLGVLTSAEGLNNQLDPLLTQIGTAQEGLSAADQTFLANADDQFVSAAQNMLSADEAFVAADQAGDLSGNSFNSVDLTLLDGALGLLSADFNVGGATLLAAFDPDIGALTAASAADTVTDATTPAQLLSEGDADLTDASAVLSGIDLSGQSSDISSIVTNETSIVGSSLTIQDQIASFQTEIVDTQTQLVGTPGYDVVSQATNDLLTQADQGLFNADNALLTSTQLLAATIADGSGLTDADMLSGTAAMLQLVSADFGALGTTFDAAFTPFLELFTAF